MLSEIRILTEAVLRIKNCELQEIPRNEINKKKTRLYMYIHQYIVKVRNREK